MLILAAFCVIFQIPFLFKAFHIDDPLFVWTAKHIVSDPLNFYGFNVNWYSQPVSISKFMMNPPLASYYMSLFGVFLGWQEAWLHSAFILPTIAVCLGTYKLAREYNSNGLIAGLCVLLAPGFFVSSTSLMSDVFMLAFWVWSLFFWRRAVQQRKFLFYLAASFLCGLACVTKYYAVVLIPLQFLYLVMVRRKFTTEFFYFLIPISFLLGLNFWGHAVYGVNFVSNATNYSVKEGGGFSEALKRGVSAIAFVGGCHLTYLFFGTKLFQRKVWIGAAIGTVFILMWAIEQQALHLKYVKGHEATLLAHCAVMIFAGFIFSFSSLSLFRFMKIEDAVMFFLWIWGTFIFSAILNWTTNVRSIIPMTVALAILSSLLISDKTSGRFSRSLFIPVLFSGIFSLFVGFGDMQLAHAHRQAAEQIMQKANGRQVYFQGHWGFQYYMELAGARPLNKKKIEAKPGDFLIQPRGTNYKRWKFYEKHEFVEKVLIPQRWWVQTLDEVARAGFYNAVWGPVPYVFGKPHDERFDIYVVAE